MIGTDPLDQAWWLAARSAGVVAYLALSASVVLGLTMAVRIAPVRARPGLRVLHERVALIALGALGAHALFLLGDGWLHPGLGGVLVPFAMGYRPLWTGLGILGGYLAVALSLSYYLRRRLGTRRWRSAHRFIPFAWALATVHVLGAGTDAGSVWLEAPLALSVGAIAILLGYRVVVGRRPARRVEPAPPGRVASPSAG